MSSVFDVLHLHATGAIVVASFFALLLAAFWTVRAQQLAKQRPSSGLYASKQPQVGGRGW